jgi:hypothetical protein
LAGFGLKAWRTWALSNTATPRTGWSLIAFRLPA